VGGIRGLPGSIARCVHLAAIALALAACSSGSAPSEASHPATAFADPCAFPAAARRFNVLQVSMEPTLQPGDQVVVEPATLTAGEIVVFPAPTGFSGESTVPFIKRIIGVAGDVVELRDGSVFVDNVQLAEPYVYPGDSTNPSSVSGGQTRWSVPNGYLFVLGDHREESQDSRAFGPIPTASVLGRVSYRCLPADRRGPIPSP
jgi:signal peptidase I